jgi:hypothetical protein
MLVSLAGAEVDLSLQPWLVFSLLYLLAGLCTQHYSPSLEQADPVLLFQQLFEQALVSLCSLEPEVFQVNWTLSMR